MAQEYTLSRVVRDQNFEKWVYYITQEGEVMRSDAILIFFKLKIISVYIVSFERILEDDYDYYCNVVGLTHDIGLDDELEYEVDVKHVYVKPTDSFEQDIDNFELAIEDVCTRERTKYS